MNQSGNKSDGLSLKISPYAIIYTCTPSFWTNSGARLPWWKRHRTRASWPYLPICARQTCSGQSLASAQRLLGSFKLSKIHAESPWCWLGSSWCLKSQFNVALEHIWAFSNHPAINTAYLVHPFTQVIPINIPLFTASSSHELLLFCQMDPFSIMRFSKQKIKQQKHG